MCTRDSSTAGGGRDVSSQARRCTSPAWITSPSCCGSCSQPALLYLQKHADKLVLLTSPHTLAFSLQSSLVWHWAAQIPPGPHPPTPTLLFLTVITVWKLSESSMIARPAERHERRLRLHSSAAEKRGSDAVTQPAVCWDKIFTRKPQTKAITLPRLRYTLCRGWSCRALWHWLQWNDVSQTGGKERVSLRFLWNHWKRQKKPDRVT